MASEVKKGWLSNDGKEYGIQKLDPVCVFANPRDMLSGSLKSLGLQGQVMPTNSLDEHPEIKLGICIYFYLNVGTIIKIFCIKLLINMDQLISIKIDFFLWLSQKHDSPCVLVQLGTQNLKHSGYIDSLSISQKVENFSPLSNFFFLTPSWFIQIGCLYLLTEI